MKNIKEREIHNKVDIPDEPETKGKEFESEADRLRMDAAIAKEKSAEERVPRSGQGKEVEHHRRVAGMRYRFREEVEPKGWKDLPKDLIEAAKKVMENSCEVQAPVVKPGGAKPNPTVSNKNVIHPNKVKGKKQGDTNNGE